MLYGTRWSYRGTAQGYRCCLRRLQCPRRAGLRPETVEEEPLRPWVCAMPTDAATFECRRGVFGWVRMEADRWWWLGGSRFTWSRDVTGPAS